MSDFGERFGFVEPIVDLAVGAMPNSLRNGLWDACYQGFFQKDFDSYGNSDPYFAHVCNVLWLHVFKETRDSQPARSYDKRSYVKGKFYSYGFHGVYQFIEFLANIEQKPSDRRNSKFTRNCNLILERERSAFRFAGQTLIRISDEESRLEIERAVLQDESISVGSHIKRAAQLYSQNPTPDFRNSIKESISAVEAAVSFLIGERPGGVAKPLRKIIDRYVVHPALRDGFEKLYAYSSDADGIRHALLDEATLTQADARYMLISCSAFSNYLLAKKAEPQL